MIGGDCPERKPLDPDQRRALDEEIERRAARQAKWVRPKAAVAGPQGYRKRKAG